VETIRKFSLYEKALRKQINFFLAKEKKNKNLLKASEEFKKPSLLTFCLSQKTQDEQPNRISRSIGFRKFELPRHTTF